MNRKSVLALVAAGVLVPALVMVFMPGTGEAPVSPAEVQHMMQDTAHVILLDVRTVEEFTGPGGHLAGALLIPVQELEARRGELEQLPGKTIVAYCRTGRRSGRAVEMLRRRGFHARNMSGGIVQWSAERRPVVRGDSR
jgi:rhodanese-related sulfurtransferase